MSPRLRPLQLPLLVEQRKRLEEAESELSSAASIMDSFPSDAVSPATATFSSPRGHLRYSSSTSSFELSTPATSDPPSSPTQASHKSAKRFLPDVEEEPVDPAVSEDEFEPLDPSDFDDLYDCLCAEPCFHKEHDLSKSTADFYSHQREVSYDMGFFSDGDLNMSFRSSRKARGGSESPLSGITQRLGSKFSGITRWRPSRQASLTHSPVSDFGFDQRPAMSRAASSRSSSISTSARFRPDRSNEPPLPPTPALSFYDSSDSIAMPAPVDVERLASVDLAEIERDRAMATTPLLPPMMNDTFASPPTALPSPLESPKVANISLQEPHSPLVMSPPLSTKPSVSSFHRIAMSGELPGMQEGDEHWSSQLGHANYTIVPVPYTPEIVNLESLRKLRADWDTARVNYAKHLARTGEHYGLTSKIYVLTEAKWAETKRKWRANHDRIAYTIVGSGAADAVASFDEDVLTVPHMDTEGKFPERGDEDIVGPMIREATMLTLGEHSDRKNTSFWRSLAGRVGLRK